MTRGLGAGRTLAAPTYDGASGELTAVAYCSASQTTGACATGTSNAGNGTALVIGRDANGRTTHLGWTGPGGPIVDDAVTRSQSAKVVDETVDGTDANAGGNNFAYDAVGRLTEAWVTAHHLTYAFAATGGCGPMAVAGKDSNRTATTDNGGPATTYCYDNADRLISSTDAANVGTPVYDPHGDGTRMGNQTLGYDSSGRHVATNASVPVAFGVTYTQDAASRLIARTEGTSTTRYGFAGGTSTTRYGFAGSSDSPAFAMGADNVVTQRFIALAGGAMVTKQASGDVWSYPNVHGDVVATANAAGAKQGATVSYDPFGQSVAVPDNAPSNLDYGWLGQPQRPTEHAGGSSLVEMGARPYSPATGRFLQRDPVEGGSASDYYDYVYGDPVNGSDLAGTCGHFGNPFNPCEDKGLVAVPSVQPNGSVAPLPDPTINEPTPSPVRQFVDFLNGSDSKGTSRRRRNAFSRLDSNAAKKAQTYGPVCARGGAIGAGVSVASGNVTPEGIGGKAGSGCLTNVAAKAANNNGLPSVGASIQILSALSDVKQVVQGGPVTKGVEFLRGLF
ncbi:MAG TPA: RHS repeat-associated core domain-containing protein [Acidimicrobiales bacterium]|nr:RHS repeat-associated core domain-containing protein [Acidimicrobiales bacterium]